MLLDRVRLILNIDLNDISIDEVLEEFINNYSQAVNLYCSTLTLPTELEFIVVEATIARYNRRGSEGLQTENIDVIQQAYQEDIIKPYKQYMDAYKKSQKKLRFL